MVDVRGFRTFNDNHGHAVGDELLRALAQRLSSALPSWLFLARAGSDEFAVLADAPDGPDALLQALLPLTRAPVQLSIGTWPLAACVGVTTVGAADTDADPLIRADLALQTAIDDAAGGGSGVHVLGPSSLSRAWRRAWTREALAHPNLEDFSVVFQPIVELDGAAVTAVECLLRWTDPLLGRVGPAEFIRVAEAAGSITSLTDHVLACAAAACAQWRARPATAALRVGVNLSTRDLADSRLVRRVVAAFAEYSVPLHALTVEVTEEGLLEDLEAAAVRLRELQQFGVRVALDDFGTGYASLRYLRRFRPDVIKIDREFVQAARHDPTSRMLVGKVNEIALAMGGICLAEGIEDATTARIMQLLGLHLGQGYHFATPMPLPDLHQFLADEPVVRPSRREAG